MIKNIVIIIGLPGSGKSSFLKSKSGLILDDQKNMFELPKQNTKEETLYISHPMLCLKKNQDELLRIIDEKYDNVSIDIFCFENNSKQCFLNSQKRKRDVTATLKILTKNYHIPKNASMLPVYKNNLKNKP